MAVIQKIPKPPKQKRVLVSTMVDSSVKLRLEALGIDVKRAIEHYLNEAVGHYVCPTCGALLKPKGIT